MKDGKFEVGDKVKFKHDGLNLAELNNATMEAIHTVALVGHHTNAITLNIVNGNSFHVSRFEHVPAYKVGDWVEYTNGSIAHQACVTGFTNHNFLCIQHLDGTVNRINPTLVIRKLRPSEVVLDFGNGIKGRVRKLTDANIVSVLDEVGQPIADIFMFALTDPMKSIVMDLLAAQAKEGGK